MANVFPARRRSSVVEVQAGRSGQPVVHLVPGGGGQVASVVPLARALGASRPVRVLAPPLGGARAERLTRADTVAMRHVTDLRRSDDPGPYRLVGVGTGAVLAFEVARLLRRDGLPVDLLVAVDGGPGHLGPDHRRPARPRPWAPGRAAALARRRHWDLTVGGWVPHPYDGPLHLVWAAGTASRGPSQGWGPWVSSVDVVRLAVAHDDLLTGAGVGLLAGALRSLLDGTAPGAGAPHPGSPVGPAPA